MAPALAWGLLEATANLAAMPWPGSFRRKITGNISLIFLGPILTKIVGYRLDLLIWYPLRPSKSWILAFTHRGKILSYINFRRGSHWENTGITEIGTKNSCCPWTAVLKLVKLISTGCNWIFYGCRFWTDLWPIMHHMALPKPVFDGLPWFANQPDKGASFKSLAEKGSLRSSNSAGSMINAT